jgi:hypothetical protein
MPAAEIITSFYRQNESVFTKWILNNVPEITEEKDASLFFNQFVVGVDSDNLLDLHEYAAVYALLRGADYLALYKNVVDSIRNLTHEMINRDDAVNEQIAFQTERYFNLIYSELLKIMIRYGHQSDGIQPVSRSYN